MKKIMFFALAIASIGLFSFTPKKSTKKTSNDIINFTVDGNKSKVNWTGSKKSDFHTGYFPVKSGNVQVDGGKLTGGSFIINLKEINLTDGTGDDLKKHLLSPAFFDIEKFMDATFTITKVEYNNPKANKATITGNLSLHGISAPVTFTASIRNADEKGFFAEAFLPFDRTVFGINYGVGMIDTEVQLAIHIYGSK
jgi:polyisoprenoid-binding protein YceI